MNKLKELLEEQLQDEYNQNDELRKENKDLSDELLELKETNYKTLIEKEELKARVDKLDHIREWLSEINSDILKTSVDSIKAKKMLQENLNRTTKGKLLTKAKIINF